jgi:N6-L-threonylcarbamoyladenine synthase
MRILAIESSCDETAAAVVEDGRSVLSSVIASQVEQHIVYGGVVPEIAGRMHTECISGVVSEALSKADCSIRDIDAVAVTAAPGLIGALLVGVSFAKGLSYSAGKPLIPVHHLRGHIAANYIAHAELTPPFLCLVVSGGHSHIVNVKSYTDMEVVGRTLDDAAGEAFDKTARIMGLPYPGGVHLDKIAEDGDEYAFKLPVPRVEGAYNFSFSGLKTAMLNTINQLRQKGAGDTLPVADLAASMRRSVVDILCQKFLLAAKDLGASKLVLAGGVSANRLLRRTMTERAEQKGLELYYPPLSLCGDNAAMIGSQAYYEYLAGVTAPLSLNACASMPIDRAF